MSRRARANDRRTLRGDLSRWRANAGDAVGGADRLLRDAVAAEPLLAVGAAAGVGFLLGGGVPRGAVTTLLAVGGRMATAWLQRELFENPKEQE